MHGQHVEASRELEGDQTVAISAGNPDSSCGNRVFVRGPPSLAMQSRFDLDRQAARWPAPTEWDRTSRCRASRV